MGGRSVFPTAPNKQRNSHVHLGASEFRTLLFVLLRLGEIQRSLRLLFLEELQGEPVLLGGAAPGGPAALAR